MLTLNETEEKRKRMNTRLREEGRIIEREVREKSVGYITAGLGVVSGFAWNEAIKSLIEFIFPLTRNGIIAKFAYAVLMTVVVVFISIYLLRFFSSKKEK